MSTQSSESPGGFSRRAADGWRIADRILCLTVLAIALFALLWVSVPRVRIGLTSADDAWFALVAKSVASGQGYGTPITSETFVPYDPAIGSGPVLLLPAALFIRLFGPLDWLPGLTALILFVGQLGLLTFLLGRRFGWIAGAATVGSATLLLSIAVSYDWFIGALLGEPTTLGYLLIAALLLNRLPSRNGAVIAGGVLSLAFLTKQIALFGALGIVGAWIVTCVIERIPLATVMLRTAAMAAAGAILPALFELSKLWTLGPPGYRSLWKTAVKFTKEQAVGAGDPASRWSEFLRVLRDSYWISPLLLVLFCLAGLVAIVLAIRRGGARPGERVAFLLWSGAVAHLAYTGFVSILWVRYFWVGAGLGCFAVAAFLLESTPRTRVVALALLLVSIPAFGLHARVFDLHRWWTESHPESERAEIVRMTASRPRVPLVAAGWSSIYDIVYLRRDTPRWFVGSTAEALRGETFFAITNAAFTDRDGEFARAVEATCRPLTPRASRTSAWSCGDDYWSYGARAVAKASVTAGLFRRMTLKSPGDKVGLIQLDATRGILMHPGETTPTIGTFALDGRSQPLRLSLAIGPLDQAGRAVADAGIVDVDVEIDGRRIVSARVDRDRPFTKALDVRGARQLTIRVDSAGRSWWDWLYVSFENDASGVGVRAEGAALR
jgi:hypothetical protein